MFVCCLQFYQKQTKTIRHSTVSLIFRPLFGRIEDTKKDISKLTDLYYFPKVVLALRNIDNDPKKSDIVFAGNKIFQSLFVCFSFV